MIKRLLETVWLGIQQLRYNTHYLLVAMLVIVLPGLFVWVSQNSFELAYQNVNTSSRDAISIVHDSVESSIKSGVSHSSLQSYVERVVSRDNDINKMRILLEVEDGLQIINSHDKSEIGLNEGGNELYVSAAIDPGETFNFDLSFNGARTWQSFRQIKVQNKTYYIFTEYSFAKIDALVTAKQQQSYLALSAVFLFLIFLATWLLKQTNWHKKYATTKKKLDEQMMFTNTIAHELRAPLTAIRGYISFLKESSNIVGSEKSYVENTDTAATRLLALINDFLEVARIQAGKLKLQFKEIDVRQVIKAVHTEFQQVADDKNLDFDLKLPQKPIVAETDPARLQQVLTNLVSNAIKYTDSGSVKIHLEQTKLKTIIRIKDTGHGISAEDQQKLFGAFTRVGNADSSKTTGTGLGMWITKQLIELLHGTVAVESIEGVGTHVKLTFDV